MGFTHFIATTVLDVFNSLCWGYNLIVIASCFISWVNPDPYNPIVRFLRAATEPICYRIRKYLPFVVVSGFDLSPIVLILGLNVFQKIVNYAVLSLVSVAI